MLESPRSDPATILNVDDSPTTRCGLSHLLREAGFVVREAATGEEALQMAAEQPDLILLDVILPGINGFEVCRRLKSEAATAGIPVLLVSAVSVRSQDRVRGLEGGADGYLSKPVDPDELVAQIRALLRVRRAEEQSRPLAKHLQLLLQSTGEGIYGLDGEGRVTFINRAGAALLGYTPEEVLGREMHALSHHLRPDGSPFPREECPIYRSITRGEGVRLVEDVFWKKDGSPLPVECSSFPVADGAVQGAVVTFNDITERKRAEEALVREREFLRAVLDNLQEGVIACDSTGALTLVNRVAREVGGVRDDRLPAAEWARHYTVYHRDGKTPLRLEEMPLFRALQGERVRDAELVIRSTAGELRNMLASGQAFYDARGKRLGAVIVLHDVTERQRLEEQVRQAQKMEAIGRLAGGIAHDFNNLLTVITGFAEVILNQLPPDADVWPLVGEIRKAGERAAALTQQLLAYGRKQILTPVVLDLNAVINDMARLLHRTLGEDVELVTVLDPNLARIRADPGQIGQVILNLAVNARDAMPHGGKLTIETRNVELGETYTQAHLEVRPGPYVLLAVSDTGCGMDPEVRARVFEPFFTTKEVGKGTGLGLATVYGIVKQSGGHVEVYSEPRIGTSFKLYLPRIGETVRPAHEAGDVTSTPRGLETVLLVEDEEAVRNFTRLTLREFGYTVLAAAGGAEALAIAGRHRGPIQLLLTDVVMPGMNGREVAERFLALRPEAKVIYLSGYTDDAIVRHGILQEGVHFLQKPFTPAALAQKVRAVLDAPA